YKVENNAFTVPLPHEEAVPDRVPVLKLHGSVDWTASGDTHERVRAIEALTQPAGKVPAIATPGRSKAPDGNPPFPLLWQKAEKALSQAQWVVFVGYRFPPTDAVAKFRLLKALREDLAPFMRRYDTVLGASIDSEDSRRLHTLLMSARGLDG